MVAFRLGETSLFEQAQSKENGPCVLNEELVLCGQPFPLLLHMTVVRIIDPAN